MLAREPMVRGSGSHEAAGDVVPCSATNMVGVDATEHAVMEVQWELAHGSSQPLRASLHGCGVFP